MAVDDRSKISFSILQGTSPWQPIFVCFVQKNEFQWHSVDGVSLRQEVQLIRWTQAASGAAGRARRWACRVPSLWNVSTCATLMLFYWSRTVYQQFLCEYFSANCRSTSHYSDRPLVMRGRIVQDENVRAQMSWDRRSLLEIATTFSHSLQFISQNS